MAAVQVELAVGLEHGWWNDVALLDELDARCAIYHITCKNRCPSRRALNPRFPAKTWLGLT
jgi:hypothetical protein